MASNPWEFIEPDMAQARQRFVYQIGFADVREANEIFKVVVTPTGDYGVVAEMVSLSRSISTIASGISR